MEPSLEAEDHLMWKLKSSGEASPVAFKRVNSSLLSSWLSHEGLQQRLDVIRVVSGLLILGYKCRGLQEVDR